MKKRNRKRILSILLTACLMLCLFQTEIPIQAKATKKTKVKVTKITLKNPEFTTLTLKKGKTLQVHVSISPKNASNKKVSYKTSNKKIVTVSKTGIIKGIRKGTATIIIKACDGSKKKAKFKVIVGKRVTKLTLKKKSTTLSVNKTYKISTTISPKNASYKALYYKSSNKKVATVSQKGVVKGIKAGKATITVKAKDGSKKTAKLTVTVKKAAVKVKTIVLSEQSKNVTVGTKFTLTAKITPANATNKGVTWSSSNSQVATVASNGEVTAVQEGTAIITATAADGSKVTGNCAVTVTSVPKPDVQSVTLSETNKTMHLGEKVTLKATIAPADAANQTLTWSSSKPHIATINQNGEIEAIGIGSTNISVSASNGITAHCEVKVINKEKRAIELKTSISDIEVNTKELVVFTADVSNLGSHPEQVEVLKAKDNTKLISLYDNGENGDDIAGDNIYSAKTYITSSTKNQEYYYAKSGDVPSNQVMINFYKTIQSGELNKVTTVINELDAKRQGFDINQPGGLEGVIAAAKQYLDEKVVSGEVTSYEVTENNIMIWFSNGITYAYAIIDAQVDGAGQAREEDESQAAATLPGKNRGVTKDANTGNYKVASFQPCLNMYDSSLSSSLALIDQAAESVGKVTGYEFNDNYDNTAVNISALKKLADYKVVLWHGHGGYSESLGSYLLTGEISNDSTIRSYSADLQANRILLANNKYCITSAFIDQYYGDDDLDGMIIYLGACLSGKSSVLANSFLNAGAKTVLANSESIYTVYNCKMENAFYKTLAGSNQPTAAQALAEAKKQHGDRDRKVTFLQWLFGERAAETLLFGDENFKLDQFDVNDNGSFEQLLKGWQYTGDVRVISKLGLLAPTHEKNMAIMSTGLGAVTESNSTLSGIFAIPSGKTKITIDYDFVSEEPMEYVGTIFDDVMTIQLADIQGNKNEVARETVNTATWVKLGTSYFADGDNTTYHTGWKTVTYDISGYQNYVNLLFNIWDKGDSLYDSAIIIDHIRFE